MHINAYKMGITQRVTQFMEWLREETAKPQHGIAALTIMDLGDTTMEKRQGIKN